MGCRNCSYIEDEFNNRMEWYYDDHDDIYDHTPYDACIDEEERNCWCEKVGGRICWNGQCEDADIALNKSNKSIDYEKYNEHYRKLKRRDKRNRDLKYKNHIKFLAQSIPYYPLPAIPVDKNRIWNFDDPVGTSYYKRIYRGNRSHNRYNFYKKYANKIVRRYKGEIHNGCAYKKCFDYWCNVD